MKTLVFQSKIGDGSLNAAPAVIMTISKQPGVNTLELTERLDAAVLELQEVLPAGVEIHNQIFRQSSFIETSIDNLNQTLLEGAFFVVIVLFIFLLNWRTTVISLLAIPISLLVSIIVLKLLGYTINTMSLGGMAIAIGALVDDAIIDVENVFKRLRENSKLPATKQKASIDVIFEASKEIRSSIINATLIIMIVFLPLFFLSGVEGRMLKPLGLAYIVSIGASLIIAMTVTPAMCYYLLRGEGVKGKLEESWFTKKLKSGYENVLDFTLQFKKSILLGTLGLFIVAIILVPFLGRSFLPEFNEGTLVISTVTIPGTSLDESNEMGTRIEKILLAHPGIISTSRRTGRAELDEHAQGVNASEIDAKFEVPEGYTKEEMLNEIRADLSIVPGTNITIGQPIGHRIDHMLSGTRANIAVKIFGSDLYELRSKAEEVRAQMENITGVVDLSVEQQQNVPQIQIKPDRRALARYGITIEDLSEMVDVAFAGEVVSQILEEDKMFDLTVRFDENHRGSMDKIRQARFNLESGVIIPLSELASIESKSGPNTISRENVQRKIVVSANVSGRDLRSTVDEIRANVETNVSFPQGYFVEYGGQFESAAQATRTISLLSIISILGIYLLLYLEFGSLKTALLVMVNLPFALIGGIFTVMFTSGIVSIASLVGFITLFGIATRNGILMVSHYQQLLSEGKEFLEAIRQGSLERLNPILMTALTAGLALIPLAIAVGEPGNEIQSPMAQVILGGLISSTLLNMIVIPALFAQFSSETMN